MSLSIISAWEFSKMPRNVNLSINSENEFMCEFKAEFKFKNFLLCEKFEFQHNLSLYVSFNMNLRIFVNTGKCRIHLWPYDIVAKCEFTSIRLMSLCYTETWPYIHCGLHLQLPYKKFICAWWHSSAHAQGTKFKSGNFKHFETSVGHARWWMFSLNIFDHGLYCLYYERSITDVSTSVVILALL